MGGLNKFSSLFFNKNQMKYKEIIKKLKSLADQKNVKGMARFGIDTKNSLGISVYIVRDVAKEIKKIDSKPAKWIALDALRELTSEKVQKRLKAQK